MTLTADPPSSNFGAINLDALLPAILPSSPSFAAAGDRAGSNLIQVNQTKSNQWAHASRPPPKETHEADLADPLQKGIQS